MKQKTFIRIILFISLFAVIIPAATYDQIIMTYNTENYGNDPGSDNDREDDFRLIINEIDPDVLIVEEIHGETAFDTFSSDVLNYSTSNLYSGTFINQINVIQDIGLFYKTGQYTVISTQLVEITSSSGLRDAFEVKLKHNESSVQFYIYGVHLKAGDGSSEKDKRASETSALRSHCNDLPAGTPFIITGDFNLYTSSETAWTNLTGSTSDNDGRVSDPINQAGSWHENSSYEDYHTQNTRYSAGGLDDRFDFILISDAISSEGNMNYKSGSYTTYGNDGNHLNSSVNYGANSAVSAAIADALYEASDHLPVYATFSFSGSAAENPELYISEYSDASGTGNYIYEFIEIYNNGDASIDVENYVLRQQNATHSFTVPSGTSIPSKGFLVVGRDASKSAFESFWNMSFSASVTYLNSSGAIPQINGEEVFLFENTGSVNVDPATDDEYSAQSISPGKRVYRKTTDNTSSDWVMEDCSNATPGALGDHVDQSLPVELQDFNAVPGNGKVTLAWITESETENLGFNIYRSVNKNGEFLMLNAELIAGHGSTSERHEYSYVDRNVINGVTCYYKLEDVDYAGKAELHDKVVSATPTSKESDANINEFRLYPCYPNPFNPSTNIRISLPENAPLKLQVYNLNGGLINTLVNKSLSAGEYSFTWNATDFRGTDVASGVYFIRMAIENQSTSLQKVLLVR